MDKIENLWREINERSGQESPVPAMPSTTDFQPSAQNMLGEMLRKVRYKLWFIYASVAAFGAWLIRHLAVGGSREVTFLILGMFLFGLLNISLVLPSYLRMKRQSGLMSGTFRETIEFYYQQLRRIIRQENLVAAVFAPLAAMLGFSYAIIEETGSVAFIFERPWLVAVMIITGLITGALGAWMAVWMNRSAFGKYLRYLKENLERLGTE